MIAVLTILALLAYLVPVLPSVRRSPRADSLMLQALGLGAVAHVLSLGWGWWLAGKVPLESMQWSLSAVALVVVVGSGLSRQQPRMAALGPVLSVLGASLLAVSLFAPREPATSVASAVLVPLHVGLVLLGFAGLLVAAAIAVLYLWVRQRLKAKRLDGIGRLPNLEALDALGLRTTVAGFLALSTGIAIGLLYLVGGTRGMSLDVTMWATAALWTWYAVALHLRLIMGWRGRVVALFGVGGLVGVGALVVVGFALEGWHGFGA